MPRRWVIVAAAALFYVAVVYAQALPPLALNPSGTDAVVFGKLRIESSGSTDAPLVLPVFSSDPGSPANDELWILDDGGSTHQMRFRSGGVTYFANFTEVP